MTSARWLVARAFIDAAFWHDRKKSMGLTMITRMTSGLWVEPTEPLEMANVPANEVVLKDLRITLLSSRQSWRLITFSSRRGHVFEFLTNEFDLAPGVIAFLYSRCCEEEKCFDTWKNDFSLAKAWGASVAAIENQVRLAIATSLLVDLLMHHRMGQHGNADDRAFRKQAARQTPKTDGTDRPDWSASASRYTSKVNRQVLRFSKHCFHRPASGALDEAQLRPLLLGYL